MGSPSLLNGDFFENIARLTDFSWSSFLSSDPFPTNATTTVENVSKYNENSLPFFVPIILFVGPSVYSFATVTIIMKLSKCIKITRDRLVKAGSLVLSGYIVSALYLFASRMFPDFDGILITNFSLAAGYHWTTLATALVFVARENIWPTGTKEDFYKYRYAGRLFFTLTLLLFLFTPVYRPNVCPAKIERQLSEFYFLLSFIVLWLGVYGFSYFHNFCSAEGYDILKGEKYIGKLVKKEGFGWIEYLNENNSTEEARTQLV